ncbi:hypothetical protein L7F22_058364 [Adiantum nelumboides]|nr:hypothetical protein [Adiantum nelumboides]
MLIPRNTQQTVKFLVIRTILQAIISAGRPIVYSISPGVRANPLMATLVNSVVNMYRITGDDWDTWHDLQSHFDVARDFAAAGLIGAPGLLGFSWPDLDMLPIGFLTDPGADHGPNRLSRLSLEEQRTQMTLWAMARSPLMFGGDMVNVDDTTIDILTNQIALEINGNSYGNTEVQISGVLQHYTPSVKLLDCNDAAGTYWNLRSGSRSKNTLKLCWIQKELIDGGCFYWKPSSAAFTAGKQNKISTQQFRAGRVLIHENWPSCLEALGNDQNTFSPCSQQRTQIWHVTPDKKLVNQRTKLCAVVNQLNYTGSIAEQRHFDTRIWMARGLGGEFYVAFFNLQKWSADISVPLIGIVEEGLKLSRATNYTNSIRQWVDSRMDYQCKGKEAWSDQEVEAGSGILHATLPPHGCALFSLQCNLS